MSGASPHDTHSTATRYIIEGPANDEAFANASRIADVLNASLEGVAVPEYETGPASKVPAFVVKSHTPEHWEAKRRQELIEYLGARDFPESGPVIYSGQGRLFGGEWALAELASSWYGVSTSSLGPPEVRSLSRAIMAATSRSSRQQAIASETMGPRALIVVDVQYDFCEGGALGVPHGSEVIPVMNELRRSVQWDAIFLTMDWHPADHVSFASNNPGTTVMTEVELEGVGKQMMWPDHCVQASRGAELHRDLDREESDVIIKKGMVRQVDSYSGFGDATDDKRLEKTPLHDELEKRGIKTVFIGGLAADYCVAYTAKDAAKFGYQTFLITDATRAIAEESREKEWNICKELGVHFVESKDIPPKSHKE